MTELVRDRAKTQTQEVCALNSVVILSMPSNQFILNWGSQRTKKSYNTDDTVIARYGKDPESTEEF